MTQRAGRRLLIFSVAAIAIATLTPGGDEPSITGFCILCGERGLSDVLSNILLFSPLGFALARMGHPLWRSALIGSAFSFGIELAQLTVIDGRHSNVGDVMANGVGSIVGWFVGSTRQWWLSTGDDVLRCVAVTASTAAVLFAGLLLFAPAPPDSIYYMQWTPRLGNMAPYRGEVLSARLGELHLPPAQRIQEGDSVRRTLFSNTLEIVATPALPSSFAPIVAIADDRQRHIMMLGADRADLVYRYRMVAAAFELDHGDLRVHQAFQHVHDAERFTLRWTVDRKGYCLELNGRNECGRGFTVGDTWSLLMSLDWGTDERAVLRALWMWLVFIPAGLLARRARTILMAGALTTAVFIIGPLVSGFAATPIYQLIAVWIALASGQLLMRSSVSAIGRKR